MSIPSNLIQQARKADLASYLLSIGEPLILDGTRFKHKNHDSLVFTKNAYFWNSRQEHGNAIDFLVRHKHMDFKKAVIELCNAQTDTAINISPQDNETEYADNFKRTIAYLHKTRCIDYSTISYLINSAHIYQEKNTNNIIFPIYNEGNTYVGAELEGSLSAKRFKGIRTSRHGYGYNVRFGDKFKYLFFFESAVDLLSFISLKQYHEKKQLNNSLLISMAGLKQSIVLNSLKAFSFDSSIFLCVDNDKAGFQFQNTIKQLIDFKMYSPDKRFKDWNEQLCNQVQLQS